MAKTPPGTVADTGAEPGQVLVGIDEHLLNRGLRIKVHGRQARGGSRIEGSFDLIEAGNGAYSRQLAKHVGESFLKAADLIDEVRVSGGHGQDCRHILNKNKLRRAGQ